MTGYAGLVSRTLAYLIDTLTVGLLTGAGLTALAAVASVVGTEARKLAEMLLSGYLVFLPALLAVYCALFWSLAGRTPGMAVLGVRVVRSDGRPVRWFAALVRGLLLAYFPIGALWLLVDRRRQGLPDKVAMTTVIREG
ncbi:RDD family protein [Actinoplanes oblitus]|uniref:RDD family protein n=1 Tax=Actinoplanes oblitus TaxID=3040509 RepID=A0ABY8WPB5_9ACTN|nr:RDD family protein [Actinoplanes oblitus]WIM98398.1 RDD family protein [Actinoplanes oblitus]